MKSRLAEKYQTEVVPQLIKEGDYKNPIRVPRLVKVVINIGLGEAQSDKGVLDAAAEQIGIITGQRPVFTKARKSISAFKLRAGEKIGVMVTLRKDKMFAFLDKFLNVVLPRLRDFRGVPSTSFDGRGNFSLGLREQIIFSEIDYKNLDKLRGLQITIVTTAKSNQEARRLLELLGMPFVLDEAGAKR